MEPELDVSGKVERGSEGISAPPKPETVMKDSRLRRACHSVQMVPLPAFASSDPPYSDEVHCLHRAVILPARTGRGLMQSDVPTGSCPPQSSMRYVPRG